MAFHDSTAPHNGPHEQKVQTPEPILADALRVISHIIDKKVRVLFDPCPIDWKPTTHKDGLTIPWKPATFVNPPYNDVSKWLEKGAMEAKAGNCSVFLIPVALYVRRNLAALRKCNRAYCSFMFQGIRFVGYENKFPYPLMFLVMVPSGCKAPPMTPIRCTTREAAGMSLIRRSGFRRIFHEGGMDKTKKVVLSEGGPKPKLSGVESISVSRRSKRIVCLEFKDTGLTVADFERTLPKCMDLNVARMDNNAWAERLDRPGDVVFFSPHPKLERGGGLLGSAAAFQG